MTPQKQRNEQLAQTIIKNLKRRHIEGFYCATAEETMKKVSELIADGSRNARRQASHLSQGVLGRCVSVECQRYLGRWRYSEYRWQRKPCGSHHLGTK